jgi:hypothetical protein
VNEMDIQLENVAEKEFFVHDFDDLETMDNEDCMAMWSKMC